MQSCQNGVMDMIRSFLLSLGIFTFLVIFSDDVKTKNIELAHQRENYVSLETSSLHKLEQEVQSEIQTNELSLSTLQSKDHSVLSAHYEN